MLYILSIIFALAAGRFANRCILRLPKDESLWNPCSQSSNGSKSSMMIETLMVTFFLFHAWFFAGSWILILIADVLSFYLVVISLIDYRHRIIPDELSFSLAAIGLIISFVNPYLS